jgi:hypothetical protein
MDTAMCFIKQFSPTGGGRSVGIVSSRIKAMELVRHVVFVNSYCISKDVCVVEL